MQSAIPDRHTAESRQHEHKQGKRQFSYDVADSNRAALIDAHIQTMNESDFSDVYAYFGAEEKDAIQRLCAATAPERSLALLHNIEAVATAATRFAGLFRGHVDRLHGDDIINKAADEIDGEGR